MNQSQLVLISLIDAHLHSLLEKTLLFLLASILHSFDSKLIGHEGHTYIKKKRKET
jgi:hypothetical protein